MSYPVVDEVECIACGVCESVCPADPNVFQVEDVSKVVNPESCIACEACVQNCPVSCIKLED